MMGFWAGFYEAWEKYDDREEKRKLLEKQIGAKRKDQILTLANKVGIRGASEAINRDALTFLANRIGDAEGGQEKLSAIAKSGLATQVVKDIKEAEQKHDIIIKGPTLVDHVQIFPGQEGERPQHRFTLKQLLEMPEEAFANDKLHAEVLAPLVQQKQGSPGLVDIDPTLYRSTDSNVVDSTMDEFDRRLVEHITPVAGNHTEGIQNPELYAQLQALSGSDPNARANARTNLMNSAFGLEVYRDMVSNPERPQYSVLKSSGGMFNRLQSASEAYDKWNTYSPEEQDFYRDKYGTMFTKYLEQNPISVNTGVPQP